MVCQFDQLDQSRLAARDLLPGVKDPGHFKRARGLLEGQGQHHRERTLHVAGAQTDQLVTLNHRDTGVARHGVQVTGDDRPRRVVAGGASHDIVTDARGMEVYNVFLDLRNHSLPIVPESLRSTLSAILRDDAPPMGEIVGTAPELDQLVQRALRVPSMEVLSYTEARTRFERDYLVGLLKITDGNVADAARLADRNRTEFYRLMQKHGLTPGLFRSDGPVAE